MPIWKKIKLALHKPPHWKAQYIPRSLNIVANLLSHRKSPQLIIFQSLLINVFPLYLSRRIHAESSSSTSETIFAQVQDQSSNVSSSQKNTTFGTVILANSRLEGVSTSSSLSVCNNSTSAYLGRTFDPG